MQELDSQYLSRLEELATEIQSSDLLAQYLEEEEEEIYLALKEAFEPLIAQLHEEVADKDPLQLPSLEVVLLEPEFEGLYLPKILGYTVLRGEMDEHYSYTRPQDHFKAVLLAICNSSNFDILRKRIGQSIQMGFALSSDIWVTNLINTIENKKVRYFLQSLKNERLHHLNERRAALARYRRQFVNDNYQSAEFPQTLPEMKVLQPALKSFLLYRAASKFNNRSLIPHLQALIENAEFKGSQEYLEILVLYAAFFEPDKDSRKALAKHFNEVRQSMPEFDDQYLDYLLELHHNPAVDVTPQVDLRVSLILDKKINDKLSRYYQLMDELHGKGYMTEEAQQAVTAFYSSFEGLSPINECVRLTIYGYFARFILNLEEEDYLEFFDISKLFSPYMAIFANQQFNQYLKELSLSYVAKLLIKYTDKRGKDYQDIKKFVTTAFQDFGFLNEKEVVEMFKTRRKRKKSEE
jgi:hypothetical protein